MLINIPGTTSSSLSVTYLFVIHRTYHKIFFAYLTRSLFAHLF